MSPPHCRFRLVRFPFRCGFPARVLALILALLLPLACIPVERGVEPVDLTVKEPDMEAATGSPAAGRSRSVDPAPEIRPPESPVQPDAPSSGFYRGYLAWGPGMHEFRDLATGQAWWINDRTREIEFRYQSTGVGIYAPLYAEVYGYLDKPDKNEAWANEYERMLVVTEIGSMGRPPSEAGQASEYYPTAVGSVWRYSTGAFENAGYTSEVIRASGRRCQLVRRDTGAVTSFVLDVQPDVVRIVYSAEESGRGDPPNRLKEPANRDLIILKGPIRAGLSWSDGSQRSEIRRVGMTIETGGKNWPNVIEVNREPLGGTVHYEVLEYYARGVGLVKSRFLAQDLEREAVLEKYVPSAEP